MLPEITMRWKTKNLVLHKFCWRPVSQDNPVFSGRIRFSALRDGRNLCYGEADQDEFEIVSVCIGGEEIYVPQMQNL